MLNDGSFGSLQFDDFNSITGKDAIADAGADVNTITSDGLAHDINNLLLVIQNTLELAWPTPRTKTDREAIDTIRLAIGKAKELASDIMEASSTCKIANRIPTSPADLVTAFKPLLRGIAAKNIKLNFRIHKDVPNVKVNRDQFCEILINLVKNASEAFGGKPGEVTVGASAEALTLKTVQTYCGYGCQPKPGNGTVLTVEDTGPGTSPEFLDLIMEKSFTTKKSGHGLGLANVVELVKFNQGGICIITSPGNGFKFNIWIPETHEAVIPIAENRDEALGDGFHGQLEGEYVGKRHCVLMLDDDPAILQSSALLLNSMQTDAIMVDNTDEAFKMFNENREIIDMIFLDANVGRNSTLPLLVNFRKIDPTIPCVIVSGYAESKIRGIFNPELYNGFLGKPYTRSDIRNMLARFSPKSAF